MSSCMYLRTCSHTARCGPSRTTTCTFRFEADAPWGRNQMLMNMQNQLLNSTPSPPSSRRTWSQYHQTRSWLRIHTNQRYILMMLATSQTCLPTATTFLT